MMLDGLDTRACVELMIDDHQRVPEALHGAAAALAELIDAVSPADVREVAQRILVTEHLNLAVVGPFRSDRRFRSLLSL